MTLAGPDDPPIHLDDVPEQGWEVGELQATRRRLGAAAGAHRIGVAVIDVAPGRRSTPPHSHADEEEIFLVLEGDGLSWQSSGRAPACYPIAAGDVLVHPANGPAHTLIAGERGLRVLVVAEGSRTNITYLPRTKQFWLGPRWSPAERPHPFQADAEAGPLPLPEPTAERPPSIVALADCPLETGGEGRFRWATRNGGRVAGARQLVLATDELPPGSVNNPRHWHTIAEECFYVLGGGGTAVIGEARHPLRPGSFFLRPPRSGVGHRIEAGPEGLEYVTMGDLMPGDVCVYPDSAKIAVRPGVFLPIPALAYFDGEPDAAVALDPPPAPPPTGA
ncbi:cupin domain-containing protein [Patulibacter defluvii]|uniref:cupin domain-containing protein n=1 Tax=Patulibacter defluvii TaxID=3095358 RepID=UPI002A74F3E4|nr:cupin domain-containing protein [Patulibacter sp. DM4]